MINCGNQYCEQMTGRPSDWLMISHAAEESPDYYCSAECLRESLVDQKPQSTPEEPFADFFAPDRRTTDENTLHEIDPQALTLYEYKQYVEGALNYESAVYAAAGRVPTVKEAGELTTKITTTLIDLREKYLERRPDGFKEASEDCPDCCAGL